MPKINARMATVDNMAAYTAVNYNNVEDAPHANTIKQLGAGDPASLRIAANSTNLMSITNGNSVPMRGMLPIEQMSDCDLYKFFPYTAYFDRIPSYTYYALANRS